MSFITQKGATGPLAINANGSFQASTDANLATLVGTRWDLSDGRELIFVSVAAAGSATAGHLMQDAALIALHQNATVGTFTAYSNNGKVPASAVITLGATAMTANQYQGGLAVVTSGTGIGQTLRITKNTAAIASGTQGTITFEDGPNVSLVANDRISLIPAHGLNVIDAPTTITNAVAGIALYPIAAGSYGFLTSKGITAALSDAKVTTVGGSISQSVTTAGTVTGGTSGTVVSGVIGYAIIAGVSAQAQPVFINV